MAHLRSSVTRCRVYGCSTRASEALYSWRNELVGEYCKKHAQAALRDHEKMEEIFHARVRAEGYE